MTIDRRRIEAVLADPRMAGLLRLFRGLFRPPPGQGRIALALFTGMLCHVTFGLAVLAMMVAMFFGMSESLGRVPQPWSWLANLALVVQFPVAHSLLLTPRGGRVLARLVPGPHGETLATTTYALIASAQLLALFAFWTPSGIIWWRAEGTAFFAICIAYACAWLLLLKASFDAGAEVQSGALGWMSLIAKVRPIFPDMPTQGLFRLIRQPIYVAFALTLWTVPVWTPDQFLLALSYTAYCLVAPRLKEKRFAARYGTRFEAYRAAVPYAVPRLNRDRGGKSDPQPDTSARSAPGAR
jgi:protein-S-isoprenylcysteine O-methyltransferase Ste14